MASPPGVRPSPVPEVEQRPAIRSWPRRPVLVGAALAGVLIAVWLLRGGVPGQDGEAAGPPAQPAPSADETPTTAEVVSTVAASLVTIQTDPGTARAGLGTGMIANADGTVLTAFHVVRGATQIRLGYADGTRSTATVARADPATDIALLTPRTLPEVVVPVVLGGGAAVGDPVIAIGNPFGLVGSTTTGVVSGLGRTTAGEGDVELRGLIQFDAAVNRGSSGGPLLNAKGQVVGVVVALANPGGAGTFVGIGFAVPIGAALGSDGQGVPGPQL